MQSTNIASYPKIHNYKSDEQKIITKKIIPIKIIIQLI